MKIRDGREFYEALVIEVLPGVVPAPKPTIAQPDQFESETGFLLPQSYREYALVFGPGKLLTDWEIAVPGYGQGRFWDLHAIGDPIRPEEHWVGYEVEEYRERVHRCRYFCYMYKTAYGWDPTEVTDPEAHEYAIYHMIDDGRVLRVADTFREFVERMASQMLAIPDWDEEELGPALVFEPARRAQPLPMNGLHGRDRPTG